MASRGLLKGARSVKKALREVETEMRELLGGTEEKSLSVMRGHCKLMIFFHQKETENKNELEARPDLE